MISAILLLLLSPASAQPPAVAVSTPAFAGPALRLVAEEDYPRFEESFKSKAGLVKAARKAIEYLETLPPAKTIRVADRDYGPAQLVESARAIIELAQKAKTADEFDEKVREGFDVFQSAGLDGTGRVVFSSYYQPLLRASLKKTAAYPYPLYRRPKDMVEVDLAAFGKANGETSLLGRLTPDGAVVPYYTRGDIDRRKALAGKGLEIAWLKDRFDALDLHIQGSAILKFPDGKERLLKYAATNGKAYNSVGLTLVKAGVFARDEITHDKLREYLRKNPDAESWILAANPRYVFFELAPLPEDGEPFGATEQSLVPARSIAVDPAFMPLGGLYFFSTTSPQTDKDGRLLATAENSRFAFGLDTGGAIKSPGRVDIYAGHGPQAAATARGQWADGRLYLLVKKLPPRER
ncbi:MAG: MltA domain-containing protein [Elusimicrobia bacterium]|nr:MltA domain-containing protein [Elusimicrobiota bacterium]